jgi:hypothetical protein
MTEIQTLDIRIPAEIIHNWGWFLAFGIALAVLGVLAVGRAVVATIVSMLFFGWLLNTKIGVSSCVETFGTAVRFCAGDAVRLADASAPSPPSAMSAEARDRFFGV